MKNNIILTLEYNLGWRIFILSFFIFSIYFSSIFIIFYINLLMFIIGLMCCLLFTFVFLDTIFFKRVIFTKFNVIKYWSIFGKNYINKIKYKDLKIIHSKKGYVFGTLNFTEKKAGFFKRFCFFVSLTPLQDETIKQVKQILIEKEILKGDEYDWNY
ncbi:hypothetical protein AEBR_1912 [Halarcobacter ebronensis]|uniref:DUF304 domain-containing protein n=1 Tax=Halarcobacter ebronensis TaxID=1462615 RepID=A0A4V1M0R3_9BACT|nr:hypothetical protein AEBR_1912 [Halarcobacter ebronensis]RXK07585.1 hypothetical protein CRV07_03740 [Halarcobacter ebronensis]